MVLVSVQLKLEHWGSGLVRERDREQHPEEQKNVAYCYQDVKSSELGV